MMRWASAAVLLLGASGCGGSSGTQVRLELSSTAPLLLGAVEGYGGTPGRHYELWVELAGGAREQVVRFAIVPASDADVTLHLVNPDAPQLRDIDTREFLGYVDSSCPIFGPCGGSRVDSARDLSTTVLALITREDDGPDDGQPSDDVLLRGPVQPFARGTLRGILGDPGGAPQPFGDILLIPQIDGAELFSSTGGAGDECITPENCEPGMTCLEGRCSEEAIACGAGTELINGVCVPADRLLCGTGTTERDGVCVRNDAGDAS